jgi:sugar (pentulose or hexulose) kinase
MPAASHIARQLFWMEAGWPDAVARARWMLGSPQYWAWRLSGVAASERTYLAAQSHLWNVPGDRFTGIVAERGWERLLPAMQPAWKALGTLKPQIARRLDLPEGIEILCGIHDSSANFYRYQQAGLQNLSVVSTGTWIVGLSDAFEPGALAETSGMTWNADVHGRPLTGMLAMGGREFAIIAGVGADRPVDRGTLARLVESGAMALPSFVNDDGPFRGSAGQGRLAGSAPGSPEERRALALLYVALLTDACLDLMGSGQNIVLDGSFVTDPLYASLVAALRPGSAIFVSNDAYGTAVGAALLANHEKRDGPVQARLDSPEPLHLPRIDLYRQRWRDLAGDAQRATMGNQA